MQITEDIDRLLDLGYSIATESNYVTLFDMILDSCVRFTNADGGKLYIASEGKLKHLLDINLTLDADRKMSSSQADKMAAGDEDTDIFTYCYHHPEDMLNIPDLYEDKRFDISQIKEYDKAHKYLTQSALVAPILEPGQQVLGVMMLYNCMDVGRNIIPFNTDYERMVQSLTAQMANTLTSMNLIQDQEELLGSFVEALTTGIDARTPYNAKHTKHVARYCKEITDYINALHTKGNINVFISPNEQEQLHMAAMLHDIGKMITPREVLNKATRLGEGYSDLKNKLEKIRLRMKIDMLEHKMQVELWQEEDEVLEKFLSQLDTFNTSGFLDEKQIAFIDEVAKKQYEGLDGEIIPYLTDEENQSLHIRKGTLTDEERKTVNLHVSYTAQMLSKINFYDKYDKVMEIASNHHEYLDGSGYPRGLKDDQLDILTRILTVCDIFDSLTADDRPYKKRMNLEQALRVLKEMADEGKLDDGIVVIVANYMHEHFDKLFAEMKEEERLEKEEQEKVFGDFGSDASASENKDNKTLQANAVNEQMEQVKPVDAVNTGNPSNVNIPVSGTPVMAETPVQQTMQPLLAEAPVRQNTQPVQADIIGQQNAQPEAAGQQPLLAKEPKQAADASTSFGFRPNVNVELISPIRADGLYSANTQAPQENNRFTQSFRGIEGILQTVGMKPSAGDFPQ